MKRSLNYTNRQRIRQSDVSITIALPETGPAFFDAIFSLDEYSLPGDAHVYLEAYHRSEYMRFSYSTVANQRPPANRSLEDFGRTDAVLFRVKAVSSKGALLAEADRIRPALAEEVDQAKQPLLPVRYDDLGDELWQVEFAEDTPVLLVNSEIPDRNSFVRSTAFGCIAWPAILRQVLTRVLVIDDFSDTEAQEDWRSLWLQLGMRLGAEKPVAGSADPGQAADWIERVVASFCKKHNLRSRFETHVLTTDGQS
jgi:hypothetical protein